MSQAKQESILDEESVRQLSKELGEPEWLLQRRLEAFNHFTDMEMPNFKYGLSLYFPIKDLELEDYKVSQGNIKIEGEANIMTIHEALKDEEYEALLKEYFMNKAYYTAENKLTAYHGAFWTDAVLVHVKEGQDAGEVTIKSSNEGAGLLHVLVIAEKDSKANIVDMQTGKTGLKSHGVELFMKDNSKVWYETLQSLGENVWNFTKKRAVISRNAELEWFTTTLGGKASQAEVSTDLAAEGSKTHNRGLFLGTGEQRFDIYNTAIHSAPHTYSDMDNKGIVKDKAKSIYRGLIHIKERAHDCNGYQTQDTLILSDEAEADAVPNLEINNNEVKCSHGATIGQVDDEKIFYLMSRGLSRKEAESEIVHGFLGAMTDHIKSDTLKKEVKKLMEEKLE